METPIIDADAEFEDLDDPILTGQAIDSQAIALIQGEKAADTPAALPTGELALNPKDFEQLFMPSLTVEKARERIDLTKRLFEELLEPGKDFGRLPGTVEDMLLFRGAQKVAAFFGLSIRVNHQEGQVVPGNPAAGIPAFVLYRYKATVLKGSMLLAEAEGMCHSEEDAMKWVWVKCAAPESKEDRENMVESKMGRWGGKDKNEWEEKRPNPNPLNLINRICKIAQKRAIVAAIERATAASQAFAKGLYSSKQKSGAGGNGNGSRSGDGPANEPDGSTKFWRRVNEISADRAAASQIANRVIAKEITWDEAIKQLG